MRGTGIWMMLAIAVPAHAQPTPEALEQAEQLFDDARALLKSQQYARACDTFARSFELGHVIGAELNLGDCAERDGRLADAWRLFDAAARDWEQQGDRERAGYARASADRLLARLATIVLVLPDADVLSARIGERELPPAREVREVVMPGETELVVAIRGRQPVRRTVDARAGVTTTIDVATTAPVPPAALERQPAPTTRPWVLPLAVATGAAALAGGALGTWRWSAATYDRAQGEPDDDRQRDLVRDANRQYHLAQGLGIASVACAGAAVWLYVRSRQHEPAREKTARWTVTPILAGDRGGLLLGAWY